jgi:hypothetical protein
MMRGRLSKRPRGFAKQAQSGLAITTNGATTQSQPCVQGIAERNIDNLTSCIEPGPAKYPTISVQGQIPSLILSWINSLLSQDSVLSWINPLAPRSPKQSCHGLIPSWHWAQSCHGLIPRHPANEGPSVHQTQVYIKTFWTFRIDECMQSQASSAQVQDY